jgi:putative membrane protein
MNLDLLQPYSFNALWNPGLIVLSIVLAIAYVTVVGPLRVLFPDSSPVNLKQKVSFFAGLMVFYFSLGSPLHLIAHDFLFSAHMLEQALTYMVMPPLLLMGIPAWLLRPVVKNQLIKKTIIRLTHPLIAALAFPILFSFYHFPLIFDVVNANSPLHTFSHTLLLFAAFIMWWPMTSPLAELNQLSELKKLGCLFANGVLLYPACGMIIFANKILYDTFVGSPQLIPILAPLDDQQLGGIVMKFVQEGVIATAIGIIIYQWFRKENSSQKIDPVRPVEEKSIITLS